MKAEVKQSVSKVGSVSKVIEPNRFELRLRRFEVCTERN